METSRLDKWARQNHGLITREASELSRSAWYRALDAGRFIPVHPGVARLPGAPRTPEQRIAAAVLAAQPSGLASHRSCVRLWGVPRPDEDPVDVLVVGRSPTRQLEGVIVHRPRDQRRIEPHHRQGIACTHVLRALVDLGAVDAGSVADAVGHVLTTRLTSVAALERAVIDHSERGRAGVPALRDAVAEWRVDGKPSDSTLEKAMRRLIARYRLPPVEFHAIIEGSQVDFRVTGTPIILECDGWTWHALDRAQFEHDRERDAVLIAAGWIVVRFSYHAITKMPGRVAQRIREALARWSDRPAPDAA